MPPARPSSVNGRLSRVPPAEGRRFPGLDSPTGARRAGAGTRGPCRTVQVMERRTKIVATIGPASRDPEVLVRMVEAGMDVARLNFSHGTAELHAETAQRVRDAAGRAGRPVAILQDLPGPKLRIGALRDDTAELAAGDCVTFVCGNGSPPGDARAHVDRLGRARQRHRAGRDPLPRRRLGAPARGRGALRRRRDRRRGRGRRHRRLAPGPEHPRPARHPAGGAGGGPRAPARRPADRRRPRGAELRAPPRGRPLRARAHAHAADRQDREAAGRSSAPRRSSRSPTA